MGHANKKTIVIEIDKETGKIATETFGYVGASCIDDINKLMADLAKLTGDSSKPDRWRTEIAGEHSVKVGRQR